MTKIWRPVGLAAILPLLSAPTWGLGLGDMQMRSYLNEPLRAEIQLLDVAGLNAEDIRIRLATQDDFDRLGVDRAYFLTSLQFTVEIDDGGAGKILLTTEQPLLEPYLDFIVETRWPSGRLLREYTVLVDLPRAAGAPVMSSSQSAPQRSTPAPEAAAEPEPEPAPVASRPSARRYDAEAAERPASGGQYLVQQADTLWAIAANARPAGASVEQTMLATVDLNPEAFAAGNINGLKAGYVLDLPSSDDINLTQREASGAVAQQNTDWRNGVRSEPALRVVADSDIEVLPEEDFEEFSTEQAGEVATEDGETDTIMGAEVAASSSDTDEDIAAIRSQLGDLSDQIENLRDLVTVKDAQIAELQAQLAANETMAEEPAAEITAAPPQSATTQPVTTAPVQVTSPAPAPVTRPAPPPESGFMGMPWWMLGAVGIAIAGLLGLLVARRSRGGAAEGPTVAEAAGVSAPVVAPDNTVEQAPAEAAEPEPEPEESAEMDDSGERGYGKKLHNDYAAENPLSDAIAEADIYIAYGRYQQALDLLNTALANDPGNASGYLKMLDIYLKTDRLGEARGLLDPLRQTGDQAAIEEAETRVAERETQSSSAGIDLGELAEPIDEDLGAGLDLDLSEPEPAEVDTPEPLPAGEPDIEVAAAPESAGELSFDLETVEDTAIADASAELELDLETVGSEPEPSLDLEAEEAPVDAGDSDRLPPELAEVLGTDVAPEEEDAAERDDDDELVYATEADPMDTKLDLARAYLDMGDEEGARPVLEEVIEGGDLQQQADARELLLRIE